MHVIGVARATTKVALTNLVYNIMCFFVTYTEKFYLQNRSMYRKGLKAHAFIICSSVF